MLLALLCTIILIAAVAGLFFSVGLAAALIGGLFMGISMTVIKLFILPRFEKRDKMRLANDNVRIIPEKLEVRYDNYKNGYVIDCYYHSPETGRQFVFTTQPLPNDPTPYLRDTKITVVANRIDYSNYYVDLGGIGGYLPDNRL
ncbi:hypothetical protein [uncultured Ruminococcus sp.]|uniref:hypothetical protein n=1 Tax=uncultured Ruminococcus sp. TaxID=165186 RepID=UPI000EC3F464|nr:hypothetical protein [uncultured Ruminococcus sp.]HCJ41999.1 hypothetical protein [Ruminococcus sp.]